MPNQQKYRPISFRPPEEDRIWLTEHAKRTGRAVNAVLVAALSEYRIRYEQALARSHPVTAKPDQPKPCPHPKARVIKGFCGACGTNVGLPPKNGDKQ